MKGFATPGIANARFVPQDAARIAVIMLNWNAWKKTTIAITSLLHSKYDNYDFVLVENGSMDDSLQQLSRWLSLNIKDFTVLTPLQDANRGVAVHGNSSRVHLLHAGQNLGYTGGMNAGITYAIGNLAPDFVFLLNNDAQVEEYCLVNLVAAASVHHAAIAGAVVRKTDGEGFHFLGADPWKEFFTLRDHKRPIELPEVWETGRVEGSGILLESDFLRELITKTGYVFDPRLFFYCDDTYLALSAQRSKRKIIMVKNAVIMHELAQSGGGVGNPTQYYYITRNRIYLANRWLSPARLILFHAYYAPSRLLRIAQRFLQGKGEVSRAIFEALWDGYLGHYGRWSRHDLVRRG
jgi:GT2 family glycosyltransferase